MDDKEQQLKARQLLTPEFRASYEHVLKPQPRNKGGPLMYSIEMLFDKTEVKLADLQKPAIAALKQKFGAKENWPQGMNYPWADGDKPMGKKKKLRPEAKGMWVLKASTNAEYSAPPVVDEQGTPLITNKQFYSGCYARAQLTALAYDNESAGVKFLLDGVQKLRDGEPLGGRKTAAEMFGIAESEDDTDLGDGEEIGDEAEASFM